MTPEEASEAIDRFLHQLAHVDPAAVGGSVHLHCTDVAGEWTVREADGGLAVAREHAKGDCAIRGGAVDILAVLHGQSSLSTVDVVGDADVAARFVAATKPA